MAPDYTSLVIIRVLLGFSIGGELVLMPNLLAEVLPRRVIPDL